MTLTEEARDLIRAYLESKPQLSVAAMARSCSMPATTARSIVQGEVQKASVENITALLLTFMSPSDVTGLLAKHASENLWKGLYGVMAAAGDQGSRTEGIVSEHGIPWKHPDHLILAMACLDKGVSRAWLIRKFGEIATLPRIDALLNAGLICETNGMLRINGVLSEHR